MFPTPIYCLKWKTLKWIVSLNLMQGSLSNFSVSILKINSKLKATLNTKSDRWWGKRCIPVVVLWCSGYHYCTISFNEAWNQVLGRFKSCSWHDRDSGWWGFLTMSPAGNKVKCLTPVNHTTKTIHHHHKCVLFIIFWHIQRRKNGMRRLRCLHHEQKWKLWKFSPSFCNNKNVFTVCNIFRNDFLPFISVKFRLSANMFFILWFSMSFC